MDTARRAVILDFEDRRNAFQRAVADLMGEASKRGVLMSSMTLLGVQDLVKTEYEVRAMRAWQAWLRALSTQSSVVTTDLRPFLLDEIRTALEKECRDLDERVSEVNQMVHHMGAPNPQQFIQTTRNRALERVANEIDYTILEATSKHATDATSATFNFYGQVGAVQTGAGAIASVSIGADQRGAIQTALTAVKEQVTKAPELTERERSQVLELVADVDSEVKKAEPNTHKLRATLNGVGSAIQTMGSTAAAYALLKGAAALVGVHLP